MKNGVFDIYDQPQIEVAEKLTLKELHDCLRNGRNSPEPYSRRAILGIATARLCIHSFAQTCVSHTGMTTPSHRGAEKPPLNG
jgi:hypothetical protein